MFDYDDDCIAVVIRDGSACRTAGELDKIFCDDVADLIAAANDKGLVGVDKVWRAESIRARAELALFRSKVDETLLEAVEDLDQCVYEGENLLAEVGMWFVAWDDGYIIYENEV